MLFRLFPARLICFMASVMVCTGAATLAQDAIVVETPASAVELLRERGRTIFAESCADCHGAQGQGDDSAYELPLAGDDTVGQLAKLVSETMPEGSPEDCVGEDAQAVAEFMHFSFYSEAAQIRNRPPRVALARLTGEQLRQSLADLYGRFLWYVAPGEERGVSATYYDSAKRRDENKKLERIDSQLNFDFGRESPAEGIEPEEFAIDWRGGILAEESGRYEVVVRSTCSFVMNLGADNREFINNHVQSGGKTEFRKSLQLTGGRIYPFSISFAQRKRKTEQPPAEIALSWVPPHGRETVIPNRNLVPGYQPAAFALQTVLPPDDRSYGYERGIAVNRAWDDSTTAAAIEFAHVAFDELWPAYRQKHRKEEKTERQLLADFLTELVDTAFRNPLTAEQRLIYIDKQLTQEPDDLEAAKRVMLIALKSPRFLYPTADAHQSVSQRVANRIALTLFDSLPTDDYLRKSSLDGAFTTEGEIRGYIEQHVRDYPVRNKTREFLHSWLNLSHFGEISKDADAFPGFSQELVADLRTSLELFLDDVVWSESSDFRDLFLSKTGFTSPLMSEFYGTDWSAKDQSDSAGESGFARRASDEQRFGLLTHPYLLSGLAYHDSTSPIHRGVFLIRYMLGRTLRPPAEAFTPLSPDLHPDLTTRERVDLQTSPASCQVCHSKINGLGFALEGLDAVGMARDSERSKPINASGSYVTRDGEQVEFDGVKELAKFLAYSEDSQRAFVARAFQHFVKQPPAAFGPETLDRLTQYFQESDFNIQKLIVEIAVVSAKAALEPADSELAQVEG